MPRKLRLGLFLSVAEIQKNLLIFELTACENRRKNVN